MLKAYAQRPQKPPFNYRVLKKLFERGRMTHRQWIGETCLLNREVLKETERFVRKTKQHVMINERACLKHWFARITGQEGLEADR